VTVVDPETGKVLSGRTVVMEGSRIVSVGSKAPQGARVVNGAGKFVMPGLWDMHSHFRASGGDLELNVANGVLGIRNMGASENVYALREAIATGKKRGPKIVTSGAIIDGPDSWSNARFTVSVKTPEEARAAVRNHKSKGADFLKPYDQLTPELYQALMDEARVQRIPVGGHLPGAIRALEAASAGQRSFEHGMPLGAASPDEAGYLRERADQSVFREAMRTKNFALIPAKIARVENDMMDQFDRKRADEFYRELGKLGVFLCPTLVTYRSLTFIDDIVAKPDLRAVYATAKERETWKPENGMLARYRTEDYKAMRKRQYAKVMEEIPRARALGVRFLAGTDVTLPFIYPGFSVHDELALFVEAGLTPAEALRTATTYPAMLLGLTKSWGRVAKGYEANLVLVDGDPLKDICNTARIAAVVRNGELLERAQLDELLKAAEVR